MIGQKVLLKEVNRLLESDSFPKFSVVMGRRGSGKRELCKYVAEKLNLKIVRPENDEVTMEAVKDIIEQAYKPHEPTLYILPEYDKWNFKQEVILKVVEEPPKDSYFIATALRDTYVRDTVKSRAYPFRMNVYTPGELREFAEYRGIELDEGEYYTNLLKCPGDILALVKQKKDVEEFTSFVRNVLDNIGEVSGANSFKIADRISFSREDETGFSVQGFWNIFKQECLEKTNIHNTPNRGMYFRFITITTSYQNKLYIKGINQRVLFDMWIVDIRKTYLSYNR